LKTEVFTNFTKGDRASFKTIFEYYYGFVFKFVSNIIQHDEDAADITSDTFVTLWKTKDRIKEPQALKSYLCTISTNAARDYFKKNKVARKYVREMSRTMDDKDIQTDAKFRAVMYLQLEEAMTTLPTGCRSVFEMIYFENLKTEEIAQKLRITPRTVLNQKGKAIKLMRKAVLVQNNIALLELYELIVRHH